MPAPDELVFVSWFEGGEVFRSGCCWKRGRGRIFYFRPGHESYAHFKNEQILHVIHNAVRWAAPHKIEATPVHQRSNNRWKQSAKKTDRTSKRGTHEMLPLSVSI